MEGLSQTPYYFGFVVEDDGRARQFASFLLQYS